MADTTTATPATVAGKTTIEREIVADSTGSVVSTGKTVIADIVVSKIAGIATREITGVYDLGGTAARTVGLIRDRIGTRTNLSQGVSVEVGETQAAIDLQIIAEYGVSIADLASAIRSNVISAIERMTGLEVTEVNIAVSDVHLEGDDDNNDADAEPAEPRVQ
ncbi:Asp23/Gls24 family envelope stress response protein [Kribbella sp. NBC_01505]|uniref:Asp23/Gls24 family envelope stress response protein n=1 Tax=Kribbella sp. NBC_01505 TaxID=2903580 RepID=UPI0038675DAC